MTGDEGLRAAVTALIGLAAAAEQELLAEPRPDAGCGAEHWAAAPTIAHNTDFRRQQVQRLRAIRCGQPRRAATLARRNRQEARPAC